MLKNEKGQSFIEMLLVLPLLLMVIVFFIEMGFIMYDMAVVNYAASSTVIQAAAEGQFTDTICSTTADYLHNWTSNGKELNIIRSDSPQLDSDAIVIYGPGAGDKFQRGNIITVGVIYPIKFKIFLLNNLADWTISEDNLNLKARASAASEVYFEP